MYNNTNHLQEKNQIIGSYGLVFMKTVLKLSGRPSYSIQRGYVQVVVLYKYPKSSQTDFRKDIHHHLRPVIDLNVRLVILGDFNIQIDCVNTEFVKFMETSFRCRQQIKQSTTDSGSILDLIFSNCEAFCDVVEAYWTDHKLVYCAIDQ